MARVKGQSTTLTSITRNSKALNRLLTLLVLQRLQADHSGAGLLIAALDEDINNPGAEIAARPALDAFWRWLTQPKEAL